jgi:hypothetical protein
VEGRRDKMNFELVEYYPAPCKNGTLHLGTCHIYWIEEQMDIRYINVRRSGKHIVYHMPWLYAINDEGRRIRCPVISFTDPSRQKEIIRFCQKNVTPIVLAKEKEDGREKLTI